MKRTSVIADVGAGVVLLAAVQLVLRTPLWDAIRIGGDEQFEVTKAFLVYRGIRLYDPIWNDQPPLLTLLLAVLFKTCGVDIGLARTFVLSCAAGLLSLLFRTVRTASNPYGAGFAAICLVTAPGFLALSMSCMLEVPCMAVAFGSLVVLRQRNCCRGRCSLFLSGVVLGIAAEIKWTAILMGPALIAEIAVSHASGTGGIRRHGLVADLAMWTCGVIATVVGTESVYGGGLRTAFASHFTATSAAAAQEMSVYRLSLVSVLLTNGLNSHVEGLCGVCASFVIVVVGWRRRLRPVVFPFVLLLTVALVHSIHRPYWDYYYLHFAVPIAWLTGYGIGEMIEAVNRHSGTGAWSRTWGVGMYVATLGLVCIVLTIGALRLSLEVDRLRSLPRISDSTLLKYMDGYASRTRWVYAQQPIYAFHARLSVIPDIAVVPRKRWWSGQITHGQIVESIREYSPEQVLMRADQRVEAALAEILSAHYERACSMDGYTLYVSQRIVK